MTTATQQQNLVDEAHRILNGVVEISANEMLIHGQYYTEVVSKLMKEKGTVCGGRQACLLGSVALSALWIRDEEREVDTIEVPLVAVRWGSTAMQEALADDSMWVAEEGQNAMKNYPALRLVIDALDEAAIERLQERTDSDDYDAGALLYAIENENGGNPAEQYFENYLEGFPQDQTHAEIVELCDRAKAKIA